MELDLCSLVSIVTSNRLENSRKLEVVKRTEVRALGHEHSTDPDCGIKRLTKKTSSLHDEKIQNKKRPGLNIKGLSDDPRRGGRREQLETLGTLPSTSNIQCSDGRKNKAPDGDNTIRLPILSPKESDITVTSRMKSNIQEEEKESRVLLPG